MLHTGGWTGQFIKEQIGVAGAHLAGGHGCDTVERPGKSQSLSRRSQGHRAECRQLLYATISSASVLSGFFFFVRIFIILKHAYTACVWVLAQSAGAHGGQWQ